jgi:hypothetical protein
VDFRRRFDVVGLVFSASCLSSGESAHKGHVCLPVCLVISISYCVFLGI